MKLSNAIGRVVVERRVGSAGVSKGHSYTAVIHPLVSTVLGVSFVQDEAYLGVVWEMMPRLWLVFRRELSLFASDRKGLKLLRRYCN